MACGGCVTPPSPRTLPDASALAPRPAMPDPLVMLDGRPVISRKQWIKERRPELKILFQHYMYGPIPAPPDQTVARLLGEYTEFLGGKATLKLVRLETGSAP